MHELNRSLYLYTYLCLLSLPLSLSLSRARARAMFGEQVNGVFANLPGWWWMWRPETQADA